LLKKVLKKLFYLGLIALALFEFLNIYFIMPMPGSQRMHSLDFAYFLYSYRWYFRVVFGLLAALGAVYAFQNKRKWVPLLAMFIATSVIYLFNVKMAADQMFKQPGKLIFQSQVGNALKDSSVVVGVNHNGAVKAYPIQFIGYHHQVQDTVGGKPVIVTYCTVCRTGRVFEPIVKGQPEKFRLVGMDHFNALFEDASTKSWWRQVNGEAVTGTRKGDVLPEVESFQLTIEQLFQQYPHALVMQADAKAFQALKYDSLARYERGKSTSSLTRTDSISWQEKSWVLGLEVNGASKAYDWIELKRASILHDVVANTPVVIALSRDGQSFGVFQRPSEEIVFQLRNDSLISVEHAYGLNGTGKQKQLKRVKASQEFWHSWQTFHPKTERYEAN
jgi:hypothetical protein